MVGGTLPGWTSPAPRLWQMRRAEVAAVAGVAAVAAGILATAVGGAVAGGIAVAAVVACGAAAAWFLRNRFRSWAYPERDEDRLASRCVLVRRLCGVPDGRMHILRVT